MSSHSETPAVRLLTAYLDVFNSGRLDAIESFIRQTFADDALRGRSPDDRAGQDFLLYHSTHGLDIKLVEKDEGQKAWGYLTARLTGQTFSFLIDLSPQDAEHIYRLSVRPVQRPASLGAREALNDNAVVKKLDHLARQMSAGDVFAGAVLLQRGEDTLFRKAYGLVSQRFNLPNVVDTKFNLGSLFKMFTAVAICQLVEKGKLNFEDRAGAYLTDYPMDAAGQVTIHQLLTHTAGMGDYWNERFEAARARVRHLRDYLPLFVDEPLLFAPGTEWRYSNAGFMVLGLIVEAVSGQSYFDYLREHIFGPGGMPHTDAYPMDRPVPNLAIGYTHSGIDWEPEPGPRRNNLFMHVVKGGPAGGGFSTVDDLANFAKALREHRLLSADMTERLWAGHVSMGSPGKEYGYGFMRYDVNGHTVVGHNGTFPGIGARFDLFLEQGYTLVVLSNYDPHAAETINFRLREWLTEGR